MQVIRYPSDTASIAQPELRELIEATIRDLSQDYKYDPDELGHFVIYEHQDTIEQLSAHMGFDILSNRWTGIRYRQDGFGPCFELVAEHPGWYEIVFIISNDFGITVYVPIADWVDPDLIAMCQQYATGAV